MKRIRIHRVTFAAWGMILLSLGLLLWAQHSTPFAEWYATRVYPALSYAVGYLTGRLPFSLGELLICALIAGAGVGLALLGAYLRGHASRRRAARFAAARTALLAGGVILLLFTLLGGINYHRLPFSHFAALEVGPSPAEELEALCRSLIGEANAQARLLPQELPTVRELGAKAPGIMEDLSREFPALEGYYPSPKPVFFSRGMSYLQLLGIYFPFTAEANFNADAPYHEIPATLCHELSHLRGFMREDEANFIAYLACEGSGDPVFRYSGALLALDYAMSGLYGVDPARCAALYEDYGERLILDLNESRVYWSRFEGPAATVSRKANDAYLKVNAQFDGVRSYDRMVDLLLARRRTQENMS